MNSVSFRFKLAHDEGLEGIFTLDNSGPECYPQVFLDGKPLAETGYFHGVCTFDAGKFERSCSDCDRPIGSRDWEFLFDDGGVCERCAGIEWV